MARGLTSWVVVALVGLTTACSRPPPPLDLAEFDAARAFRHVEYLVSLGPRPPNTPAFDQSAEYLINELRGYGLRVEDQIFHAGTPRGPLRFRNIVARTTRASNQPRQVIILGSHYDTKWMPDIEFVGANDAGSSTGLLLELARVAANQSDLWFVFFDGEECFHEYDVADGLWGSRFFVEALKADGDLARVRALVLLDMVGDRDLHIGMPANSTGWLVQQVFEAAKAAGCRDYFSLSTREILDDHVPFLEAGIPAVNLIDFEYGSAPGRNDYWHTELDTLDKLSPRSLEIVGLTTLRLLELLRR